MCSFLGGGVYVCRFLAFYKFLNDFVWNNPLPPTKKGGSNQLHHESCFLFCIFMSYFVPLGQGPDCHQSAVPGRSSWKWKDQPNQQHRRQTERSWKHQCLSHDTQDMYWDTEREPDRRSKQGQSDQNFSDKQNSQNPCDPSRAICTRK